jgi:hypothetical protein
LVSLGGAGVTSLRKTPSVETISAFLYCICGVVVLVRIYSIYVVKHCWPRNMTPVYGNSGAVRYFNIEIKVHNSWYAVILKGIGSFLFLSKMTLKNCRKKYKNHLRGDNHEVCTAVASCFPNYFRLYGPWKYKNVLR